MCQKLQLSRTSVVVLLRNWRRGAGLYQSPSSLLASPCRAASTGRSSNQAAQCGEGRGRDRDEDRDEKQLGRGQVSSESLLCILNTPKETLEDSCRPNSANIEDLGSNTLETGYGARRNTLAKCHLKIHSSQMPRTANPYPLSLPTFLSPSFFPSFLLSR